MNFIRSRLWLNPQCNAQVLETRRKTDQDQDDSNPLNNKELKCAIRKNSHLRRRSSIQNRDRLTMVATTNVLKTVGCLTAQTRWSVNGPADRNRTSKWTGVNVITQLPRQTDRRCTVNSGIDRELCVYTLDLNTRYRVHRLKILLQATTGSR